MTENREFGYPAWVRRTYWVPLIIAWIMGSWIVAGAYVGGASLAGVLLLALLFGAALIRATWEQRRGATRVRLTETGIQTEHPFGRRVVVPWADITFVEAAQSFTMGGQTRVLRLRTRAGARISITERIEDFDDLVESVTRLSNNARTSPRSLFERLTTLNS